jgi:fructokinase
VGFTIVGIGEALFDCYADGRCLPGGAPLNFAVQAHRLATRFGGRAVAVTRVGDDELGRKFLAGLDAPREGIQIDSVHPTGRVEVTVAGGEPHYVIEENVAWDFIEYAPLECDAVCFGSLAQRSPTSRASIQKFVANTPGTALRLFDVNLRQNYWSRDLIEQSLGLANAVKLNEEEVRIVGEMFGLREPAEFLTRFELATVVLTRGPRGTTLVTREGATEGAPVRCEAAPDADAVGAGDACAATVAVGLVCGWPPAQVVKMANQVGAFVASRRGALPELPLDELCVSAHLTA